MRCKPPCLAWVRKSEFPENINKVVEVTPVSNIHEGQHEWMVIGTGLVGRSRPDGPKMVHQRKLWCKDDYLTMINDPDLKVDEVEKETPKQTDRFEYVVKEKQYE